MIASALNFLFTVNGEKATSVSVVGIKSTRLGKSGITEDAQNAGMTNRQQPVPYFIKSSFL